MSPDQSVSTNILTFLSSFTHLIRASLPGDIDTCTQVDRHID